jgi:hypothetical protein
MMLGKDDVDRYVDGEETISSVGDQHCVGYADYTCRRLTLSSLESIRKSLEVS